MPKIVNIWIFFHHVMQIEDLHQIDIGLYPLIESPWALGKGGLKVLQYMSLGIPSIIGAWEICFHQYP